MSKSGEGRWQMGECRYEYYLLLTCTWMYVIHTYACIGLHKVQQLLLMLLALMTINSDWFCFVSVRTCAHTHTRTHTHTHLHAHTHARTHAHTHTHTQVWRYDGTVECYTEGHLALAIWAVIVLAIYTLFSLLVPVFTHLLLAVVSDQLKEK